MMLRVKVIGSMRSASFAGIPFSMTALELSDEVIISVLPIVRTCRTAFVCASDYDDQKQFYMFEQKKRTCIKILFKEIAGLSVVLPVRKSEKQSLLPRKRGNTAAHHSANAHDAITLVCLDTARCRCTL